MCSLSYGTKVTSKDEVRQLLCVFAERAAEKLHGEKQYCWTVYRFFRTNGYD
ncbi:DinB/UmuC family translesion DNA polymerase [Candidatus Pantoea bituminis]|uniref:DinB/UmuC family translesion DNA polymerase n=1 Tax=Candidatus Pantoea bituminis TaxID=2831036 RepID=UPI00351D22E1